MEEKTEDQAPEVQDMSGDKPRRTFVFSISENALRTTSEIVAVSSVPLLLAGFGFYRYVAASLLLLGMVTFALSCFTEGLSRRGAVVPLICVLAATLLFFVGYEKASERAERAEIAERLPPTPREEREAIFMALKEALEGYPACVDTSLGALPSDNKMDLNGNPLNVFLGNGPQINHDIESIDLTQGSRHLKLLQDAGFVELKLVIRGNRMIPEYSVRATLTDLGEQDYRVYTKNPAVASFCYADINVVSLDNYVVASNSSYDYVTIHYTYELRDVRPWAAALDKGVRKGETWLVRSGNGWVDERSLNGVRYERRGQSKVDLGPRVSPMAMERARALLSAENSPRRRSSMWVQGMAIWKPCTALA